MGYPQTGPADPAVVKARGKETDDALVAAVTAAVNAFVRRLPVTHQPLDDVGDTPWSADVVEGATLLATRLVRRKNSPAGVEAFAGDSVLYVRRSDPDIAMLLQLGDWGKPAVG